MTTTHTIGGAYVDLLDPNPATIDARDVAYGLARLPRYLGQTRGTPYSVAEHCVVLHDYMMEHHGPRLAFAALLHDAAEAYIGDVPTQVKAALGSYARDAFRELGRRMDHAILRALAPGLTVADLEHPLVKDADTRVRIDESAALRPGVVTGLDPTLAGRVGLGVVLPRWDAARARVEWTLRLEARQHADHDLCPPEPHPRRHKPDSGVQPHTGDLHAIGAE